MQLLCDFFQRVEPGCINCGHVTQADNDNRRQFLHVLCDGRYLVGGGEQKRAVNPKNSCVVRDLFVLQNVNATVFDVVVGDLGNRSSVGDSSNEEQRRQNHAGLHGNGKVSKHGQAESDQPHADVRLGQLEQLRNLAPLTHVV